MGRVRLIREDKKTHCRELRNKRWKSIKQIFFFRNTLRGSWVAQIR